MGSCPDSSLPLQSLGFLEEPEQKEHSSKCTGNSEKSFRANPPCHPRLTLFPDPELGGNIPLKLWVLLGCSCLPPKPSNNPDPTRRHHGYGWLPAPLRGHVSNVEAKYRGNQIPPGPRAQGAPWLSSACLSPPALLSLAPHPTPTSLGEQPRRLASPIQAPTHSGTCPNKSKHSRRLDQG